MNCHCYDVRDVIEAQYEETISTSLGFVSKNRLVGGQCHTLCHNHIFYVLALKSNPATINLYTDLPALYAPAKLDLRSFFELIYI
jgi:hypothetical protein